jgi:CHAD domain-containing protein
MSYRIEPRLPVTAEVRRIASVEIDAALDDLSVSRTAPETGLHACRKKIKKLRALFRLVQSGDEAFCRAENMRYRDISRSLAGAREDTALIETVDRLVKTFPSQTAGGKLDAARAALVSRRSLKAREGTGREDTIDAAVNAFEQGRLALADMDLPDEPQAAADMLADGARKAMRRARRALKAAAKDGRMEDFHELRKAVKSHWQHVLLLHRFWPAPVRRRRKALETLGDRLGDLNDVFVLQGLIAAEPGELGPKEQIALLLRLLKRSEKSLRKECLRKANNLFGDAPKPRAAKIAGRYRAGVSDLADGPAHV